MSSSRDLGLPAWSKGIRSDTALPRLPLDRALAYVDGALLVDLWDELVLPRTTRSAWHAVVTGETAEQVA